MGSVPNRVITPGIALHAIPLPRAPLLPEFPEASAFATPTTANWVYLAEAPVMLDADGDVLYRQVVVRTASPPRPVSNRRPERHEHSDPQNFLHRHRSATTPSERSRWRIRFTR